MGVEGFTKFINLRSRIFYERFKLKNCYIIIDGHAVAIHLYLEHTRSNDFLGGDYDNYANTIYKFFELLKKCGVIPIILFDGGFEKRRFETLMKRMKERIKAIERRNRVFPLFVKDLFVDIVRELKITCIRNDFECDSEVACLARNLDSPVLSNDSDFYFCDTAFIPFTSFKMRVEREMIGNKEEYYIPCQVYRIEKFLQHFKGLDREIIPMIPALLGNDYVQKGVFFKLHQYIMKMEKIHGDGNERQILIEAVISWLKHKNLKTAIGKILGRFEESKRGKILVMLNDAMQGYFQVNCSLTRYLDEKDKISISLKNVNSSVDIMKIEPIFDEGFKDFYSLDNGNETKDEDKFLSMLSQEEVSIVSDSFSEKYRKCLLAQSLMDVRVWNIYFCNPQIENISKPHSHSICENILIYIHEILKKLPTGKLTIITRQNNNILIKKLSSNSTCKVPTFDDIQHMKPEECKKLFLKVLNIDEECMYNVEKFPQEWRIFIISLFYWKLNSQNTVGKSFIYSLILCSMILNIVDSRIGFCRSMNHLMDMRKFNGNEESESAEGEGISESAMPFDKIGYSECLRCSRVLLEYFYCKTSSKAFDAELVGMFSEFQSCFQHVKYLNGLLSFPFTDAMISKFFNGTFLYNLAVHFNRTRNPACVRILLKDCPVFFSAFQVIVDCIYNYLGEGHSF